MPRVLITGFCAVPGPRRSGVQLRHVIRALSPLHSVDLLVVREGDQAYVERQGSMRVLRVPAAADAPLKAQIEAFQRALKRQLEGADYDVVHCRDGFAGLPVIELRDRLGYAVVYDLSRSPAGEVTLPAELDALYARDEDACLLAADLVLAPTQAAVDALSRRGRPDRVLLSPPGVDVDRFDWDDPPSGPPKVLYAGTIDAAHGVRVLIRAMATVIKEVDARLVLAGPCATPQFETALRDAVRDLGLTDKVELLGPVDHDQLPALIASATVCVAPSAADLTPNPSVSYPTKLLEYMACRRAIVAPRRDTVAMVVENGRDALIYEPGDPIDLARKITQLLGEPELRAKLAAAGYDRVRRELTASAARRAVRNAYNVLASRFADRFAAAVEPPPEPSKVEILADDEFEATVFEEAPRGPSENELGRVGELTDALAALDTGNTSSSQIEPPSPTVGSDTNSSFATGTLAPPPVNDDWAVTGVQNVTGYRSGGGATGGAVISGGGSAPTATDDTPSAATALSENAFVAGEIDVPTPKPAAKERTERDADTGSRTPTLERIT